MAVAKIDPKVIFASEAPAQDTPAVFTNKTVGWGESRKNGGRPTIKQSNALQQETDLKILWLNENSVTPFDATIDYPENAVTIKDGVFKILESGVWEVFLDKYSVGLGNVDNTSDLNKPISTAAQTALNLKADKSTTYTKTEVNNALDLLKPPYLSSDVVDGNQTQDQINLYGGKKYNMPVGGYPLNARALLDNGDIVKSTVDGNVNDPNVDMTGWVKENSASQIFDESGLNQQEWNDGVESIADLLSISNPKNGNRMFVKGLQGGWFEYNSSKASVNDGIMVFNGWVRITLETVIYPEWAGAVRDGLTDDSTAFQITYNAAAKYGFSVGHADGTYAVKSLITIDGSVNQFKFIVLKGSFRGNGISAKFFPSTNNGTTIKTFGNAFLEVKFLKYWNEAVSVQGIAVVDSVGGGDFAFRMTKGGFPNNVDDFRYNTGFIFEDVSTVGFKDSVVFRGNYRKDQGGIYNNNYFGQVTFSRFYAYEGESSIVLENATLNRFSAYDTMFFTMSSGAIVKRLNPLIPAEQNTEMHFMGQFNMCHFEDCRGMFRFDDAPATNERNFVTFIDTTREFCGLFDQNNGNPMGVFKHTDLTLVGRFDQKGYGENTIPELEVGSSVTTDRKLDVKLTNAKSLSPNFINVFSSEISVLNGETVTKNVFCADGTGKQFQITTDLIINSGQGGISKIESVGVTGSTGHHNVVNSLSPNIAVTCNSSANNMQQISVTNNSGATIYIWINVIKNVTGVQCYLT